MDEINAAFNRALAEMSGDSIAITDALNVQIMSRLRDIPDPEREPFDSRLIDTEPL